MQRYDHQTKAGNEGDVVKHPALVATLRALLAEHEGLFHYADTFAGRWESDLGESVAWKPGIERFASLWRGGYSDIQFWYEQWTDDQRSAYPGSSHLAEKILASRGDYAIRGFEIVDTYAAGLRHGLGDAAVLTRSATAADWVKRKPDLLFIDPPGLHSDKHPGYPTLESLLCSAKPVSNVLMWLPLIGDLTTSGPVLPLHANSVETWGECARRGFQVLAVRWSDGGPLCGCLLAYRLGLIEGAPNRHPGQGTANRRFFFRNATLELLWVEHPVDAQSECIRPTQLWERWSGRRHGSSPFGICVRPMGEPGAGTPFASWEYQPPYLPAHLVINVAADNPLAEPIWYHFGFARRPDAVPAETRQPLDRPLGIREVTRVTVTGPGLDVLSTTARLLVNSGVLVMGSSEAHTIELAFDGDKQGRRIDFRPELPLIFRW